MTQSNYTGEHKRTMVAIYDPEQTKKEEEQSGLRRKKVAAYARVSTELDSQQNSYESQIEYYTKFISENPEWDFVDVYADEGITGTSYKRRDGFNRMVEDAMGGKIDLILTKSISRFARNTVDALTITRQLKLEGIEVYFEKENISSMDNQAELIFTIMSSIAQEESRSISENVRWGIRRSMEAGKVSLPWKHFLGYEPGPDGLPQIVEEEAAVIRSIYRLYLNGKSLRDIANILTAKQVKTPFGGENWSTETIRHILSNEKYVGDAILQKTYTVDFLSKVVKKNHGERKQWYIQDSHDAIVSHEAYKRVRAEVERRRGQPGKVYNNPFFSKTFCGKCGSYYNHHTMLPDVEERVNLWFCNKSFRNPSSCASPVVDGRKYMRAAVIAFNQFFSEYVPNTDTYIQEVLTPALACNGETPRPAIIDYLSNQGSACLPLKKLDDYQVHTLLDLVRIMPDETIVFRFKNDKKIIVDINSIP